jgi:peptidase E
VAGSASFRDSGRNAYQWRTGPVIRYAIELCGRERPRVCYVGTAGGDGIPALRGFYGAMSGEQVQASHLQLFTQPNVDPREHLLTRDVIWVGGGSVANLLAVWRLHGVDAIMREAWEQGIVLGGVSAGSICWHTGGSTDSFGSPLRPVTNGLGLLPFTTAVHYDTEEERRPLYHRLIGDGTLGWGYATQDGTAIHYRGEEAHAVVSDTLGKVAYRVSRGDDGAIIEELLEPQLLGD